MAYPAGLAVFPALDDIFANPAFLRGLGWTLPVIIITAIDVLPEQAVRQPS